MGAIDYLDRPIAFHRPLISLGAGVTGALMLSQAIYWSRRTGDPEGWFYKTMAEWEEEIGLTRAEQEGARKKLVKLGVIEEMKKGIPCKLFFRVNADRLESLLQASMRKTCKQDSGKPASSAAENLQSITENTQETTTDNSLSSSQTTTRRKRNLPCPVQQIVDLFNETLPELPEVIQITEKRKKQLTARWRESPVHQSLDYWRDYFSHVRQSDFLMGRKKDFRACFDWLIAPTNFVKVVEGNYHQEVRHA